MQKKLSQDSIKIRGARVHNLKSVDLDLPLKQLIGFAGPSGSGKTSLAFHTLLNESRRRFVNSFPNALKFFSDRPTAVEVDEIFPVLPVFGLPQINPVIGSRSVVADVMRLTDVLQGLYFNYASEYCPRHGEELVSQGLGEQLRPLLGVDEVYHIFLKRERAEGIFQEGPSPQRSWGKSSQGLGPFHESDEFWELLRFKRSQLDSFDGRNQALLNPLLGEEFWLWGESWKRPKALRLSRQARCSQCEQVSGTRSLSVFTPHSALGACEACKGYGANLIYDEEKLIDSERSIDEGAIRFLSFGPLDWWLKEFKKLARKKGWSAKVPLKDQPKEFIPALLEGSGSWQGFESVRTYLESKKYKPAVRVFIRKLQKELLCEVCQGSRCGARSAAFAIDFVDRRLTLRDLASLSLGDFQKILDSPLRISTPHAQKLVRDLRHKVSLASAMGLNHLMLMRKTKTLTAGEYQRLLLLKYLSFEGTDALFVLDEPSLGLGIEEQQILIKGLRQIIAQGNSVIVIDHSSTMLSACDHLVIMGEGSGEQGGRVVYAGPRVGWKFPQPRVEPLARTQLKREKKVLHVSGIRCHGKSWPDFSLPLGQVVWAHGPAGSGKTACFVNVLAEKLHKQIHGEALVDFPGTARSIKGAHHIKDVVVVDANLNRFTSRSSLGTLTELAPAIRKHFLKLPIAKSLGLKDGHFSSNSELGMCARCEGRGQVVIEMQYLEDIVLSCEDCKGKRLKPLYAEISDGEMSVHEALSMPLHKVLPRVGLTPKFRRTWEYLKLLNLDYLSLDRQLNSLSGGERQRIYLLSKLLKNLDSALIIFENLSFGLSHQELVRMAGLLGELALRGHSLVVIDADPFFEKICTAELKF